MVPRPEAGGRMGFARYRCSGCGRVVEVAWERGRDSKNVADLSDEIRSILVDDRRQAPTFEGTPADV